VRSYLDHNATSPLRPSVKAAMLAAMEIAGNPSSVHGEGRAARKAIDDARESLGFMLGCLPQMIVFTSGGTEANNVAIRGVGAERILASAIEHPCVLEAAKATGKPVEIIPVNSEGVIDLKAFESILVRSPNTLVSIMLANNETGVVQPMDVIAAMVRGAGALLHVDAVQAFGKMQVNFGLLRCDMMTVAGHKVGGPKGVGALVIRDGLAVTPLLCGGGQELRRRAGTENVVGIAGFGALAAESIMDFRHLRDQLESSLEDIVVFGKGAQRLSNTVCFAFPGVSAETLLMNLDLAGIAVSSGSACSSGKVAASPVLAAMGIPSDIARSAIRVSLGWSTTAEDIEHFISTWQRLMARRKAKAA
jgi:cysteine desulfurase